jgi:hypothetical protein
MGVVKDLLVWVFSKRALGWFFGSKRARAASSRQRGFIQKGLLSGTHDSLKKIK